jgi:hypothetical protein
MPPWQSGVWRRGGMSVCLVAPTSRTSHPVRDPTSDPRHPMTAARYRSPLSLYPAYWWFRRSGDPDLWRIGVSRHVLWCLARRSQAHGCSGGGAGVCEPPSSSSSAFASWRSVVSHPSVNQL